jgi:hypothetical protein
MVDQSNDEQGRGSAGPAGAPADSAREPSQRALSTAAGVRLFAWPRCDDAGRLAAFARALAPLSGDADVALVVGHDSGTDGDRDLALAGLFDALAQELGEHELEVLVVELGADETGAQAAGAEAPAARPSAGEECEGRPRHTIRDGSAGDDEAQLEARLRALGASVHGLLDVGGRDPFALARLGHVPLRTADDVRRWRDSRRVAGALGSPLREALLGLGDGTALWLGGPSASQIGQLAELLPAAAHLVVANPDPSGRAARAALCAAPLAERVDWIDLGARALAQVWDEPLELLVLDGRRGLPALRRAWLDWRAHLVPGGAVVLVGNVVDGAEFLAGEGLRACTRADGAARFVAPRPVPRAAEPS